MKGIVQTGGVNQPVCYQLDFTTCIFVLFGGLVLFGVVFGLVWCFSRYYSTAFGQVDSLLETFVDSSGSSHE